MTLGDSPDPKISELEKGDKMITLKPDEAFTIIPEELWFINHNQKSLNFYIQVIPPDMRMVNGKLIGNKMGFIIHFTPATRRDEVGPPEE